MGRKLLGYWRVGKSICYYFRSYVASCYSVRVGDGTLSGEILELLELRALCNCDNAEDES